MPLTLPFHQRVDLDLTSLSGSSDRVALPLALAKVAILDILHPRPGRGYQSRPIEEILKGYR